MGDYIYSWIETEWGTSGGMEGITDGFSVLSNISPKTRL